jgi:hypothetical protein
MSIKIPLFLKKIAKNFRRHGWRLRGQNWAKKMSPNVPAVYDVFAVAIKETVGFQQPQKCGWSVAWEWSEAK